VSSQRSSFIAPMAAGNRTDTRILLSDGTHDALWHNVAFERFKDAAQVLDYAGLNDGSCRDRTYDQLIKSRRLALTFYP
jgi:hypothetical protein